MSLQTCSNSTCCCLVPLQDLSIEVLSVPFLCAQSTNYHFGSTTDIIDYTVTGNRLFVALDGTIQMMDKSIAERVGERFIRPAIDSIATAGKYAFRKVTWLCSSLDSSITGLLKKNFPYSSRSSGRYGWYVWPRSIILSARFSERIFWINLLVRVGRGHSKSGGRKPGGP